MIKVCDDIAGCVINLFLEAADILFMASNKNAEKLSKVKSLILLKLSSKKWIKSSELLKLTGQKYFDRRIRELRNELGYDIETGFINGEPAYRLRSDARAPAKPRTYLNASEKKALFDSADKCCAICGCDFSKENPHSFDHRVPLLRGGIGARENFQLVCYDCNNQKRVQCKGCELDCQKCFLAFPEKIPKGVILRFESKDLMEKITADAQRKKKTVEQYLISLIKRSVKL